MADVSANTTSLSNLFKIKYGKKSFAVFNTSTPLWSKIKKNHDEFKGKTSGLTINAVLGFTGSVGAAVIPEANIFNDVNAVLTRKKQYARMLLDREAMLAAKSSEGAFENLTKYQVKKCVESFMRNMERQLFAIENGMIFQGDGATNVTGTLNVTVTIRASATNWVDGAVEIGDSVQIAGQSTILRISNVVRSTRDVTLVGSNTAGVTIGATTTVKVYMQGINAAAATPTSGSDLTSILEVAKATSGTLYGVTVGERFQSQQINAASAGITTDLINLLVTQVEQFAGASPDLLVTSYKQYRKLSDLLGDKLRYMDVTNRDKTFRKTEFNFQGIQWNTSSGVIPIVVSKMCPDDHFFALNTDLITLYTTEAPKWFDEDGTVLLRTAFTSGSTASDSYEARYGMYGELFVHPQGQGVLYGLA